MRDLRVPRRLLEAFACFSDRGVRATSLLRCAGETALPDRIVATPMSMTTKSFHGGPADWPRSHWPRITGRALSPELQGVSAD